ncbi:MAG: NUDIX domain-containing protein [Desulfosalsimonadaceae bacterium]
MERVLCIHRDDIPRNWLKKMGTTALAPEAFYHRLKDIERYWIDRDHVEKNPNFKQIIPFGILQTPHDQKIACYQRNGTEKRLTGLWSVGIGGHINLIDCSPGGLTFEQICTRCLEREIKEETGMAVRELTPEFLGLINEEQTEVGSVHLGLVYRLTVRQPLQIIPSGELARFQWADPSELKERKLEYWSLLALKLLKGKKDA